jgi:asparagine synthetase B (glutamine-hydrolysing)
MGGFTGYLDNLDNNNQDENILKKMREKIKHREPGGPVYNEDKTLVIFSDAQSSAAEILRGYEEHGEEIAAKLRGAFAFVIYNTETHELYGARDHFGIKPFYYYLRENIFMFG